MILTLRDGFTETLERMLAALQKKPGKNREARQITRGKITALKICVEIVNNPKVKTNEAFYENLGKQLRERQNLLFTAKGAALLKAAGEIVAFQNALYLFMGISEHFFIVEQIPNNVKGS